jgi:PBSX family phage terminase large subunit
MTVSPLVGKQLHSYELADERLNIWEGSVRSSKTISSLVRWLRYVRTNPEGNLLMVGRTERVLKRNIIDEMAKMVGEHRCRLVAGSGELWLMGKRVYLAGASDERAQEKIRGLTLAGAYCDEISTYPQSFWMMLMSRLTADDPHLYGTTNPDGPSHWLLEDFLSRARLWLQHDGSVLQADAADALPLARFSFNLDDNPHLSASTVDFIKRSHSGLWYKRFVQGLWVVAEGAVFSMWDPDLHIIDVIPPIRRWLAVGVDYGQANPFHAVLLGLGIDGVLYVVSEWRHDPRKTQHQFVDSDYSEQMRDWLNQIPLPATRRQDGSWLRGVQPEFVVVDPSAASFRAQLHRDGMTPVPADNTVDDGIRVVSSLLAQGKLKIHRSCTELAREIPGYSWDDKAARLGEDKPIKVNDHGIDAMRYAIYSTRALWLPVIPMAMPMAEPDGIWGRERVTR